MAGFGLVQAGFNPRIRVGTGADALAEIAATLPHFKELQEKTSIDPYMIHYALIRQRLTLKDAVMHVGPYSFDLEVMVDKNQSEMKRFKKGSESKELPTRSNRKRALPYTKPVSRNAIARAYKHLNPRTERACRDEIVIKGTVTSLVRALNEELIWSGDHDMASDFNRPGIRHQTIADWINWVLERNYKLKANYTRGQIQQMLKKAAKGAKTRGDRNKYSGRFTTCILEFHPDQFRVFTTL
ncbi:MAG: hypothetical protein AB7G93_15000 [Bdellovibrionales bacterium]